MSTDADQLRRNIEQTRGELGDDVDALADKVTPSKIVDRQTRKVKNAFGTAKDRVMGVVSDAEDAVGGAAQATGELPRKAVDSAKGNPIAVGLIAFGTAWLLASLVPASRKEQELAATVKDAAAPLVNQAAEAAMDAADALREPAKEALTSVKDVASESASKVRDEAQAAAADVTGSEQEPSL
jgi:ElaB/YqjD/DUF883 family membrane-anchored ribosome-binding protein